MPKKKNAVQCTCMYEGDMGSEAEKKWMRFCQMHQNLEKRKKERDDVLQRLSNADQNSKKKGWLAAELEKLVKITAIIDKITEQIVSIADAVNETYRDIMKNVTHVIHKLKASDNRNNGPNSPPGSGSEIPTQRKKIRNSKPKPSGRKPGGQPGHTGANKGQTIKIDEVKTHTLEKCKCCQSKHICVTGEEHAICTERQPTPPPVTTKHFMPVYACDDCSEENMTAYAGIPRNGMFGVNVICDVIGNHIDRLPKRRNADAIKRDAIVIMADGSVQNIVDRVSDYTIMSVKEFRAHIRKCHLLHADETQVKFMGKAYWLWVFVDPLTGIAFYVIRKGRGGAVPKEVLGLDWKGILICDGWSAYSRYVIQRCWAHIIRDFETLSLKYPHYKDAETALKTLRKIFHDAKEILDKPKEVRVTYEKKLNARVRTLIRKYGDDPVLKKFIAKLGRALPDLFRFVLDPSIPPTNNLAEQMLREFVITRRIRGCIRSEKSLERTANLLTCVTNWKTMKLNPLDEVKKIIPMI